MFPEKNSILILKPLFYAENTEDLYKKEIFNDVNKDDLKEVVNRLSLSVLNIGIEKRIDNLRLFKKENEKKYRMIKIMGNRKPFDTEIKTLQGQIYMIGFNHD